VQAGLAPAQAPVHRPKPTRDRYIRVLTVLGYAVPVVLYFWYLHHYTLNVVSGDQWDDVSLIAASYKGHLTLHALWAQHNENRIFFPNLIVLALSRITAFNVSIEQYIGALFLCCAIALIIFAHKRRTPKTRWIAYCPVAILMLSVVQGGNTLWGFQLAWYMIVFALAAVIFLIDRERLSWLVLVASIALAIIGSFSSVQGLFIWVAGLLLLYYRRRSLAQMSVWVGAAIITATVYFYGFNQNVVTTTLTAPHLPGQAVEYFFQLIGSILGIPLKGYGFEADLVLAFGCVIVGLALWSLWSYGRHRDVESPTPIGLALIVYGLLFALSNTYGKVFFGPPGASTSRYTTYDLLIVVGTYLTYVGNPLVLRRSPTAERPSGRVIAILLLGAVILVQSIFGLVNGIRWARTNDQYLLDVAIVTVDIHRLPDEVVQEELYPYDSGVSVDALRSDVRFLADHRFSFFSDEESVHSFKEQAAARAQQGLFRRWSILFEPKTAMVLPHAGSILSGKTVLIASVAYDADLQRVGFELTSGTEERTIGYGKPFTFGWGLVWKSSTVPNGEYQLRSVAIDRGDHVITSPPIEVTVRN
jgi:hypothetical protein